MDHRMRLKLALLYLFILTYNETKAFIPGIDGPVINQEALEGGDTVLMCDTSTAVPDDKLMLIVWYKNDTPIYSFDARIGSAWSSDTFNNSARLYFDLKNQPTELKITKLTDEDQELYHCRVDFLITPTRNIGVNLTIVVLPNQPFFLDKEGKPIKDKIGPYQEGYALVISCLVVGGRPPPRIRWYSGDSLIDWTDGASDIPLVRENELTLHLSRDHTKPLSCKASNSKLSPAVIAVLEIEIYLPAEYVTISWSKGVQEHTLQAGEPAVAKCHAVGSHPQPELTWWLGHKHFTPNSNQSWTKENSTTVSLLEFTPTFHDNGATLSCIATNTAMAPSRGSKADVIKLNVTHSPVIEIVKVGDENTDSIIQFESLHLECEVKSNPPVYSVTWYCNDTEITKSGIWQNASLTLTSLSMKAARYHSGNYSCSAKNAVGETRAHHLAITILYSPECIGVGIKLIQETITCEVLSRPPPDTYFWHIQSSDSDVQQLTTGSPLLPLSQILGTLSGSLHVVCEASNGIGSQKHTCEKTVGLAHLRPIQPLHCDLAYEDDVFKIRCAPVENATHYEISVWKMSSSNSSLVLEHQGIMGGGVAAERGGSGPWLVKGEVGRLAGGDEAGAAACNRYGCSRPLLLRPSEILLKAASPPWWHVFLEKDVGISIGGVVLVAAFIISTMVIRKLIRNPRRAKPPVIQVLQLEDVAREYLDNLEHKNHASCSGRSCSSGYSGGSMDSEPPVVNRQRKPPPIYFWDPGPPPDVTLTLSRESAV